MHNSLIPFGDPYKPHGMVYRFGTFRSDKGIAELQCLKMLHISVIQIDFMSH